MLPKLHDHAIPEKALIQSALDGQEEAFIKLYRQHVTPLYLFIYKKVNRQEDAEDLTSETFYQALKDLARFSFQSSFKNWLFGIAKNLILAYYREKYNHPRLKLDENFAAQKKEQQPQEDQKNLQLIRQILGSLPQKYRSVLELRFMRGYTILETAHALGISEENAKVLQHRALKKARIFAAADSPQGAGEEPML